MRPVILIKTCVALLAFAQLTSAVAVQQLPTALEAAIIPEDNWAASFEVDMAPASSDRVKARVGFENVEQNAVHISWRFKAGTASPGLSTQVENVPYQPTAVCALAPRSHQFFVAGWYESLNAVVIEEWTCDMPFALAQVPKPDGSVSSSLSPVSITRRALFMARDDNAFPVRAMVSQAFTGELLLLPFVEGPALMTLHVGDGALGVTPINSVAYPYMQTARALDCGLLTTPAGPGAFVVLVRDLGHYDEGGTIKAVSSGDVLVLVDYGADGSFESATLMSWDDYHLAYPRSAWDLTFEAPPD